MPNGASSTEAVIGAPPQRWRSASFAIGTAAAAWLIYVLAALVRCVIYGLDRPADLMERHVATALVAVALSIVLYLLQRRIERGSMHRRIGVALIAAAPAAALLSVVNYNVMFVFTTPDLLRAMGVSAVAQVSITRELLNTSIENYFVFVAWSVLYVAVSHAIQTQEILRRSVALEAAARAAELRALRFQLDPHFMFNALNTVSGLIMSGRPALADRTVEALAAFLRTTLTLDASEDVPLGDELRLQELYLEIEKVRFGDRLQVHFEVPAAARELTVPALILQPLIENGIRHAVARSTAPISIWVRAGVSGGTLTLSVANDGPPGSAEGGTGLGLANVAARLVARYGVNARCVPERIDAGGFRTTLELPATPARAVPAGGRR